MSGDPPPPGDGLTFEQALAGLDEVVGKLEGGEVGLEEAVALFERGQAYLAACRERLAAAQRRIEELTSIGPPAGSRRPRPGARALLSGLRPGLRPRPARPPAGAGPASAPAA